MNECLFDILVLNKFEDKDFTDIQIHKLLEDLELTMIEEKTKLLVERAEKVKSELHWKRWMDSRLQFNSFDDNLKTRKIKEIC